jgi:hypothetical protein
MHKPSKIVEIQQLPTELLLYSTQHFAKHKPNPNNNSLRREQESKGTGTRKHKHLKKRKKPDGTCKTTKFDPKASFHCGNRKNMSGNIQSISSAMKNKGPGQANQSQSKTNTESSAAQGSQINLDVAPQAKFIPAMGEIRIPRPKLMPTATRQEGANRKEVEIQNSMGAGNIDSESGSSKQEGSEEESDT